MKYIIHYHNKYDIVTALKTRYCNIHQVQYFHILISVKLLLDVDDLASMNRNPGMQCETIIMQNIKTIHLCTVLQNTYSYHLKLHYM